MHPSPQPPGTALRGFRCATLGLACSAGIAVKIGASAALLLTGYILVVCGFQSDMPHPDMAGPLGKMRILDALVPALGTVISLFAMAKFLPERETVPDASKK